MALSNVSYLGNGSNRLFSISFPYLSSAHVKVFINGVEDTTFTFTTASSITTSSTPANLAPVLIKRVTPTLPLIDFVDGSTLNETLLDTAILQTLYVSEEASDSLTGSLSVDIADNKFNALSKVIKNVASPVNPNDGVNKAYADSTVTAASNSAVNAAASASNAATSANNASNSATNAANSAVAASNSANNALASTNFIHAGGGAVSRTTQNKLRDLVSVKDYGAVGNGIADDRASFLNADAIGSTVYVPAGNYLINSSMTLTKSLVFSEGAVLVLPTGVTITFNGSLDAGIYRIFNLTGTASIVFNTAKQLIGYPEWWGVTPSTDCRTSILACFNALPITQLQATDYYVAATLKLQTPGRTLRGSGCFYNGVTGDSTRIIGIGGSINVIQVGLDSQPANINLFTQGITLEDFQVSRDTAPVISATPVGILSKFTLYQVIRNVKVVESLRGFEFIGTVGSHFDNLWSFRSSAGTGAGTDSWYGFYINGNTTIPASGGNASLYVNNVNATNVLALGVNSTGIYIDTKWADTFVTEPELNGCSTGISIQGGASASLGYGETDLHIIKPVIDTYTFAGIFINNLSRFGAVNIIGGFAAATTGSSPTASIYISNSLGSINISDFQHIIGPASSITGGLVAVNSSNITSKGCSYMECSTVSLNMNGVTNSLFQDRVMNYSKTGVAMMQITNCDRNKFELMGSGSTGLLGLGYQAIGSLNDFNEFNCTGIDASAISGGSTNKLFINGVQITATGLSGNNLVSGVMA